MIKDELWGRSSEDSRRENCHLISASERLNPTMFVLMGFWGYTQLSRGWVTWHGMPCWPRRGGWGNRMFALWKQASMQSGWSTPQCSCCWGSSGSVWGWQFSRESMPESKSRLVTLSLWSWRRREWILGLLWLPLFPLFTESGTLLHTRGTHICSRPSLCS